MSFVRQLWLAVVLITTTVFAGSFLVSMFSASNYLEQQLLRKNLDNANSLALSISQQSKDPVTIDLLVAALFDNGHYQSITITDPNGGIIARRTQDRNDTDVPEWFIRLFPLKSLPGRAQITDGWKQYGTVTVISHNRFAYHALWQQAWAMLAWFTIIAVVSGLIGMLVLRSIRRPLSAVVEQAEAVTERRFLTIAEPRIPELKSVAHAMNRMVERIRNMFAEEAHQLETLQHELNFDGVTGLANRDYFLSRVREQLSSETGAATGALLLLRLANLAELNNRLGRAETDAQLHNIASDFAQIVAMMPEERLAARLNGSDFALFAPNADNAEMLARQLAESIVRPIQPAALGPRVVFQIGAVPYHRGDQVSELLSAADQALAIAENKGANAWHAMASTQLPIAAGGQAWRELLTNALDDSRIKLVLFPVNNTRGHEMHQECMVRLHAKTNGDWLTAGDFMPMAARLDLASTIDLVVVRQALDLLPIEPGDLAVNLSAESMADWAFHNKLAELLHQHGESCSRLWFEVPEYGVFSEYDAFRELCHILKQLGCKVGIEHFGHRFDEIQQLAVLGLDYLKVDASLVRDIAQNPDNQQLLKGVCHMAHGIGILVIAVGVQNKAEQSTLIELGIDGLTGPFIRAAA